MHWFILILSNIVSIVTISLCFILKVPQIFRLLKAGTAVGLSLQALMLELSSYSITMMYNYTSGHSILTYLEYPILLVQEFIIIAIVLNFMNHRISTFLKIILIYGLLYAAFGSGILSKTILQLLLPLTVPAGAISKAMQLMAILRSKNADSVSVMTWALSVFTNVTRIFTVYVDSKDATLLCNFGISSLFSSSVLIATIYYQRLSRQNAQMKTE